MAQALLGSRDVKKLAETYLVFLISALAGLSLQACSSGASPAVIDGGQGDDGAAGGDAPDAGAAGSGGGAGTAAAGGADGGVADGGGDARGDAASEGGAAGGPAVDAGPQDLGTADLGRPDAADGVAPPVDAGPTRIQAMVTVPATANLSGAGHSVLPPDPADHPGTFPILVDLPAGTGRTMTVTNVSGTIDIDGTGDLKFLPADGFPYRPNAIAGPSIWGVTAPATNRHAFLAGVFLGPTEPADPAPPSYAAEPTASTFSGITLAQAFLVGDGLDGAVPDTGDVQMFRVPDGATRLFLGFYEIDYGDNSGAITAQVNVAR